MGGVLRFDPLGGVAPTKCGGYVCHKRIGTVKSDKVTEPLGATGFSADGSTFRYAGLAGPDRCREILLSLPISR
jgi:hypothetical protein